MGSIEITDVAAVRGATHVAFDPWTAERLMQVGAINVLHEPDCLVIGPSRRDILEHARMRQAWWNSTEQWDRLTLSKVRWDPPVVVWVSTSLYQRVNLWRTCGWLRHLGISHRDILILEFDPVQRQRTRTPEEPTPPFHCSALVSEHPDEVLLDRLEKAQPWSAERYDRAIRLWDSYVDENPLPLVENCIRGVEGFPELAHMWAFLSCFFPRRTIEGTLRLSRFDELLLTLLSTEWQTPLALAVGESETRAKLWHLLSCTGDLFLPRRLEHWADHVVSAAVERAPGPRPDVPMKSLVYRLTERGMQLRDRGLDQLADAPRLPIAGTEAYAPSAPWALLEEGRLVCL
ncbi:hypothetical protein WME75_13460 [Sorangium sp. So ce1014]|uniref:hypothetical protein n=1 Tax=Sorangium sp. So ce1014 TaxID=3133326 RepID=UPI003F5F2ACF